LADALQVGLDGDLPLSVRTMRDAAHLAGALEDASVASLVLDGAATDWAAVLPAAVAVAERQLRHIHAEGCWPTPDQPEALFMAHRLPTTVAVHTMRHGAPLLQETP
jgi:hypothetical protein